MWFTCILNKGQIEFKNFLATTTQNSFIAGSYILKFLFISGPTLSKNYQDR